MLKDFRIITETTISTKACLVKDRILFFNQWNIIVIMVSFFGFVIKNVLANAEISPQSPTNRE